MISKASTNFLRLLMVLTALECSAHAQWPRTLEVKSVTPATQTNQVTFIISSNAWCAVASEPARAVVVSYWPPTTPSALSIHWLDAIGQPSTSSVFGVVLPKPASLASFQTFGLSVVTHPTAPLIYVWQDLAQNDLPPIGDPATNPVFRDLDHLLVYRLAGGTAELVTATCRGPNYAYARWHDGANGALGLDLANHRLLIPNLRHPTGAHENLSGFIRLDDQGLPLVTNGAAQLVTTPIPAEAGGCPVGYGWQPVSSQRVVTACAYGLVTWDLANRRAPALLWTVYTGWRARVAPHPTKPMMYIASEDRLHAVELADGYPTMFPQMITVPCIAAPLVLPKQNQLVASAPNRVSFIQLTTEGWFTDQVTSFSPPNYVGRAICYSATFDKLYVLQERAP